MIFLRLVRPVPVEVERATERVAKRKSVEHKNASIFMTPVKIWLGYPYPLGATWLGNGVNFALFSESATSVDLYCPFDSVDAPQENIRIPMTAIWLRTRQSLLGTRPMTSRRRRK